MWVFHFPEDFLVKPSPQLTTASPSPSSLTSWRDYLNYCHICSFLDISPPIIQILVSSHQVYCRISLISWPLLSFPVSSSSPKMYDYIRCMILKHSRTHFSCWNLLPTLKLLEDKIRQKGMAGWLLRPTPLSSSHCISSTANTSEWCFFTLLVSQFPWWSYLSVIQSRQHSSLEHFLQFYLGLASFFISGIVYLYHFLL